MTAFPELAGKSLLVVGGAGFVGGNLCTMLLESDIASLTIVDNLLSSEEQNVPVDQRVRLIVGSIADDAVLASLPDGLSHVWHLACYHGNQSSIHDPIADHDNNSITSLKLFDTLSRRSDLMKVVYAAAGCAVAEKTYGDPVATPEDAPVSLFHDSPYSISKLVGEMYGNYYFTRYGLPFVKARFQNVYGPREILGAGRWRGTYATVWRNVIPTFVWRALNNLPLGLDGGGQVGRDFIFVEDICRGLLACALAGQPGEAYNLASGTETTILELATIINEVSGSSAELEMRPARDWDRSGRRFGSTDKCRKQLGFTAEVGIREGIGRTVEWTRENTRLIESCIRRHDDDMRSVGAL